MINEEDQAEFRSVKASTWYGKEWLIDNGLHPGERVVVEGFHRIQPGIQVSVITAKNETTANSNNGLNKNSVREIP